MKRLAAVFFVSLALLATAAPAGAVGPNPPPKIFPCQPFPQCIMA